MYFRCRHCGKNVECGPQKDDGNTAGVLWVCNDCYQKALPKLLKEDGKPVPVENV